MIRTKVDYPENKWFACRTLHEIYRVCAADIDAARWIYRCCM